jgi:reverse gyrase
MTKQHIGFQIETALWTEFKKTLGHGEASKLVRAWIQAFLENPDKTQPLPTVQQPLTREDIKAAVREALSESVPWGDSK